MTPVTHGYAQGELSAVPAGYKPSSRHALRAAKQTTGQHQSRSLMDTEPVSLHKRHPAYH